MKKRVKKDSLVSREELLALFERVEARSLQEGDLSACNAQAGEKIINAVIQKTFRIRELHWEGRITSRGRLGRLLQIRKQDKADDPK